MRRWQDWHVIRISVEAWTAALQPIGAYAEEFTNLYEAERMIAQLRRALEQQTELTYYYNVLPQERQQCALPGVRG